MNRDEAILLISKATDGLYLKELSDSELRAIGKCLTMHHLTKIPTEDVRPLYEWIYPDKKDKK